MFAHRLAMARRISVAACFLLIGTPTSYLQAQQPQRNAGQFNPQRKQSAVRGVQQGGLGQNAGRQAVPEGPPQRFQITAQKSERINRMLGQWESTSGGVKTFRTEFVRWTYDPTFGPQNAAKSISGGEIRYAAPDRGEIRETRVAEYSAEKAKQGEKWPYSEKKGVIGEHWVCDGAAVYEFNHKSKQLIETQLPPDKRGKALADDGPLPFMFGAKASTIRERYWIREIPREKDTDPWQLELMPKRRGEDFSLLRIRLDTKEFLPVVMEIHGLNGVGRSVYQFNNRKVNSVSDNVKNFWDSFVSPRPPRGWTKIAGASAGRPNAEQAVRPAAQQR